MLICFKCTNFRWFIVFLLFFVLVINFIDRSAISFILDNISIEYNFSDVQLGFIMGSFSIGFLITALIGGLCLDKYGPKIILSLMGVSCVLSLFLMSISKEYWSFLLSRVLLGISQGAIFPAVTMAIKNWLSNKERTKALGLLFSASNVGIILSGPIVSALIYTFSWREMFIILAFLTIMWLLACIYFFKNKPEDSNFVNSKELDYITNNPSKFKKYTVYGNKYNKELVNTENKIINSKNFIGISNIFSYICFCFCFYFLISWLPCYFFRSFRIDILNQGCIVTFIWSIATLYMFFGGVLLDYIYKKTNNFQYARSYPIIFSNVISAICIMVLIINDTNFYLTLCLIVILVSCIMLTAPIYFVINIEVVKKRIGLMLGIMEVMASLAGFVSPIITGYITGITKSFSYIFILLLLLALFSSLVIYIFQCKYIKPNIN